MAFTVDKSLGYHSIEVMGLNDNIKWFATRNFHGDVMRQNKATIKSYNDRGLTPPCTKEGINLLIF